MSMDREAGEEIALIVAVAENGVIGKKGDIPWKCSSDLKHFRRLTMGRPVIMGRKTWQSLPGPLEGRDNIVISSRPGFASKGAHKAASPRQALGLARKIMAERAGEGGGHDAESGSGGSSGAGQNGERQNRETMIIGGGSIYDAFMPLASRIYYTRIYLRPKGDVFFPLPDELEGEGWKIISKRSLKAGERDDADMDFLVLTREPLQYW